MSLALPGMVLVAHDELRSLQVAHIFPYGITEWLVYGVAPF